MELVRSVIVDRPVEEVFAYLADFTTTTEWDPGTVRTTRESGDGGVGTHYRNVSKFLGRTVELTYVVVDHEPPGLISLRAENDSLIAHDTITVRPASGGGAEITYRAVFTFKGLLRYVMPLAAPAFRKLGDEAAEGIRGAFSSTP
jgi:uncharacterized protein YndB with AHSA1/START domain